LIDALEKLKVAKTKLLESVDIIIEDDIIFLIQELDSSLDTLIDLIKGKLE